MASVTYTASELKTCRNGTSWRSSYNYAGIGQSYEYDSISRFGYLGFSFNLSGKHITKISFKFTFDQAGLGDWATKSMDFYRYVSSSSPPATIGSLIGGFSATGMYYCTTTYTFDSSNNAALFNGLKDYFENGGSALIIRAPSTDSKTHSYGDYSDSYALISAASVTIEYVEKYSITYHANGGSGSIGLTYLPDNVAGNVTSSVFTPPPNSVTNHNTVYYDANGGTASKASDTNTKTVSYSFGGWNTAANGSGSSYASGAAITITGNIHLYAQWTPSSPSYSRVTSATVSRNATTSTRTVTLNYGGNGQSTTTLRSTATVSYQCTGWYTSQVGGTKRVDTNTAFTPEAETLYAQYRTTSTAFTSVTIPTPTAKEGHDFGGWVDETGAVVASGGLQYTPSDNVTLTALWIPHQHTVRIVNWLVGEVLYEAIVDYGTVFTLPSYGTRYEKQSCGSLQAYFEDDFSGHSSSVTVPVYQDYMFDDRFAYYLDGAWYGYTEEHGDSLPSGATVTIIGETEFTMYFVPTYQTTVTISTPGIDATRFGYRFQYWRSNEGYLASQRTTATFYDIVEPNVYDAEIFFYGSWVESPNTFGKNLYFKVNNQMKKAKTTYVKVDDQYKEALAIFVKADGVWKSKEEESLG